MQTWTRRGLSAVGLLEVVSLSFLGGCGGGTGAIVTHRVVLAPTETYKGSDADPNLHGFLVSYPINIGYAINVSVNGVPLDRADYGVDMYAHSLLRLRQAVAPDATVTVQYTSDEMNDGDSRVRQASQTTFHLSNSALSLSLQVETIGADGTKTLTRLSDSEVGFPDNSTRAVHITHALPVPSTLFVYYVPGVQTGEY